MLDAAQANGDYSGQDLMRAKGAFAYNNFMSGNLGNSHLSEGSGVIDKFQAPSYFVIETGELDKKIPESVEHETRIPS